MTSQVPRCTKISKGYPRSIRRTPGRLVLRAQAAWNTMKHGVSAPHLLSSADAPDFMTVRLQMHDELTISACKRGPFAQANAHTIRNEARQYDAPVATKVCASQAQQRLSLCSTCPSLPQRRALKSQPSPWWRWNPPPQPQGESNPSNVPLSWLLSSPSLKLRGETA